jgi:hypothetical protein
MIKLFRKVRQKMLTENKFSKYLIYAIGEIILVVIGILIALQLNSWKEINTERAVEKGYIVSLIEDIKKDNRNFDIAIKMNEERIKGLDSLAYLCFNYDGKHGAQLYLVYITCLSHQEFVSQTDRTLIQLRNAGGMRLITKQRTADSIVHYEDHFKKLANQQTWYEDMFRILVDAGVSTINFNYYPNLKEKISKEKADKFLKTAKLMHQDKRLLIEFGNKASVYNGVTNFYLVLLKEGKQKSLDLIKVLKTDYGLK